MTTHAMDTYGDNLSPTLAAFQNIPMILRIILIVLTHVYYYPELMGTERECMCKYRLRVILLVTEIQSETVQTFTIQT